jgi:hypothetical protein
MMQSRLMSLIEAGTNVVVGYALAIATQLVVFPLFGIESGLSEHLTIGLAFVGSLAGAGLRAAAALRAVAAVLTPPSGVQRTRPDRDGVGPGTC